MSDLFATTARAYSERNFEELVRRWHETNIVSYPYVAEQQRHSLNDARRFFRHHVLPSCEVWVAEHADNLAGLLALEAPWIRQLAVVPALQRRGVATALLRKARERSPGELRLFTFRRNASARAF